MKWIGLQVSGVQFVNEGTDIVTWEQNWSWELLVKPADGLKIVWCCCVTVVIVQTSYSGVKKSLEPLTTYVFFNFQNYGISLIQ